MPSAVIYIDESGDLGWKFDAPYRAGGSSRYLTISALCVPVEIKHVPKRLIKGLYQQFHWPTATERKWVDLSQAQRKAFAHDVASMCAKFPDIHLRAIVVQKENVLAHIRRDGNKLYNYMLKIALLDYMAARDVVTLVPDPRTVKVRSGNSLHDYLQTELWFTKNASTNLITSPLDSKSCLGIQFADMLAGLVQSRFEDNDSTSLQPVAKHVTISRLFFR